MNNTIELLIGDDSNDGHGQTKSIHIKTNFDEKEIIDAYEKGVEIIKFDVTEMCCDYEDDSIDDDFIKALQNNGIDIKFEEKWDGSEGYCITDEKFSEVYLSICKLGESSFNYEIADLPVIVIGGYGLFS